MLAFGPHHSEHLDDGKRGEIDAFPCVCPAVSPRGHPGVFSVLWKARLTGRVRPVRGGAAPPPRLRWQPAEHAHRRPRAPLLRASLAQTSFPPDCLGLPSNLTAALCLGRHSTWMDFSYF